MASGSPVAAVMALYDTLAAANFPNSSRPAIYFGEAVQADGTQVRPPYYVLRDPDGRVPEYFSNRSAVEPGTLVLEIYYGTLADADTAAAAVKYNGSSPSAKAGFDFGALSYNSPLSHVVLKRVKERRSFAALGQDNTRVHVVELTYRVVVQLTA